MDYEKMTIEELDARAAQIVIETEAEGADLDALEAEARAIQNEKEARRIAAQEAEELRNKVAAEEVGEVIEQKEIEERNKPMDNIEIRKSPEYLDAWVENLKGRATEEQRALLTENTDGGTIAVPVYVEDMIHTAWESNEIVRRARRTYFPGNLKVGVELSADPAQYHPEGGEAITEEDLEIMYINLVPSMVKKMIRATDEALALRGASFLSYLYDELEYQIVKKVGDLLVATAILQSVNGTTVQSYSYTGANVTAADIITAAGYLGGEATNPVLITTRSTAAALKAAALSAGYAYDPFDGMEVIYVDSAALTVTAGGVTLTAAAIIADLSGWQINLPEGDTVKFKFDDITEAAADMVRIIGRLYVAMDITSVGKTVVIKAA